MNIDSYIKLIEGWLAVSGPRVLMIILGAFLFMSLVKIVIALIKRTVKAKKASPEFHKRVSTFGSVIRYIVDAVIVSAALILVIKEFGLN